MNSYEAVTSQKRSTRADIMAWRDAVPESSRMAWSEQIWHQFFALSKVKDAQTIMLYSSIRSEVPSLTAMQSVLAEGKRLVLPRVNKVRRQLDTCEVRSLSELCAGPFGILEPSPQAPLVAPEQIDAVAVPGIAFDRIGYRVGYGGGYYDRFLPLLRHDAVAVGIGFSGQLIARVPRTAQDARLLLFISETGVQEQPQHKAPDRYYKGYIFDLDGTVYLGESLILGAAETIAALRRRAGVVFLSNKPINTRVDYAEKLTHLGIPTTPEDVINSSAVLAEYLREQMPGASLYCVGEPPLLRELQAAGFRVVIEPEAVGYRVDVVVAAFDRTFDYAKLNNAYQCIKQGARFVATNSDRTCPIEGGEIPDCAAMIGAIEGASTVAPEIIVGKPHPLTAQAALSHLGVDPWDCLMVGDRVETDMRMGLLAGTETALVLSGVSDEARMQREQVYPHFVIPSIHSLLD